MKQLYLLLFLLANYHPVVSQSAKGKPFSIIVFGDMPYNIPADYGRFENLIREVNIQKPLFSVHVGDIKSGSTPCSNDSYQQIFNYFNQFERPLIYTPGDNEWTDCGREKAGSYQPEERLAEVRRLFFPDGLSLGKKKMPMNVQSANPDFSKYVENRSWDQGKIAFATIHLVGSNNNLLPGTSNEEFNSREKANEAWLREIFTHAIQQESRALFLFTQADMFTADKGMDGFTSIKEELRKWTLTFGKQVILVNGDSHKFLIDKPFLKDSSGHVLENFTRVQVFGETDVHAVKIRIDPASPSVFSIEQFIVSGN